MLTSSVRIALAAVSSVAPFCTPCKIPTYNMLNFCIIEIFAKPWELFANDRNGQSYHEDTKGGAGRPHQATQASDRDDLSVTNGGHRDQGPPGSVRVSLVIMVHILYVILIVMVGMLCIWWWRWWVVWWNFLMYVKTVAREGLIQMQKKIVDHPELEAKTLTKNCVKLQF